MRVAGAGGMSVLVEERDSLSHLGPAGLGVPLTRSCEITFSE